MIKLIKLEVRKNGIRSYIHLAFIMFLIYLVTLFIFAYAPRVNPQDVNLYIFKGYGNLAHMFTMLEIVGYAILAATLYSKCIIEEYGSRRNILLFMYPVSRGKVFLSKILLNSIYILTSLIISNIVIFVIFMSVNKFMNLVEGDVNTELLMMIAARTIFTVMYTAGIGIIAMGIGLIKFSMPSVIISTVILSSLLSNVLFGSVDRSSNVLQYEKGINSFQLAILLFLFILDLFVLLFGVRKIEKIEV